jgi:preprotein translocase subunit SecE
MRKKQKEIKKIRSKENFLTTAKGSGLSWWGQLRQFLRETKIELKKVSWPNKKEIFGSTLVVIVFVLLVAAYFGLIDLVYTAIIGRFLG